MVRDAGEGGRAGGPARPEGPGKAASVEPCGHRPTQPTGRRLHSRWVRSPQRWREGEGARNESHGDQHFPAASRRTPRPTSGAQGARSTGCPRPRVPAAQGARGAPTPPFREPGRADTSGLGPPAPPALEGEGATSTAPPPPASPSPAAAGPVTPRRCRGGACRPRGPSAPSAPQDRPGAAGAPRPRPPPRGPRPAAPAPPARTPGGASGSGTSATSRRQRSARRVTDFKVRRPPRPRDALASHWLTWRAERQSPWAP